MTTPALNPFLSRRRALALGGLAGGVALTASACSSGSSGSGDPNTFEFWSFTASTRRPTSSRTGSSPPT